MNIGKWIREMESGPLTEEQYREWWSHPEQRRWRAGYFNGVMSGLILGVSVLAIALAATR